MRPSSAAPVLLAAALLLAAGCSSDDDSGTPERERTGGGASTGASADDPASPGPDVPPAKGSADVVATVAEKLNSPWGMVTLPGGDLLISSRDTARIVRIDVDSGRKTTVGEVPGVATGDGNEGGLLGLALGKDGQVYAYFTSESDNRVVRMVYEPDKPAGKQLGAPDTVFRGIPKGGRHNGGRIAFGPDGMLYVGTGETGDGPLAQDKKSLGGKILRMTPDGEPAKGNPEADSVVYSYGHRNVQGLAWDDDNRLWAAEFGDTQWDELNLIKPGENYGWPEVEGKGGTEEGYTDPVAQWPTGDASPSGIAYAKGSIWMASLRGERLWRIPLDGTGLAAEPQFFHEGSYGRLRTVLPAEDGGLWLVSNETDGRGAPKPIEDRLLKLKIS